MFALMKYSLSQFLKSGGGFILACEGLGENKWSTMHFPPAVFLFCFKWRLAPATLIPLFMPGSVHSVPQWGAADAETKVPSGENTALKRSPFEAWSRSV